MDDCEHYCDCENCANRLSTPKADRHLSEAHLENLLEETYERGKEDGKEIARETDE